MIERDALLFRLDDIQDGRAKGVTPGSGTQRLDIVLLRRGGEVFGYENRCPRQINLHSGNSA